MTRSQLIELVRRQASGGQPTDDTDFTDGLVNIWVNQGIALAARKNYTDGIQLDGIGYVNNGFYTTYKALPVTADETFLWKIQLPEIPIGIGRNEGISTLQFKDENGVLSFPCIPMSQNQKGYFQTMRPIPNKTLYYYEGSSVFAISTILLSQYTASATIVSGGDSADLSSQVNVPEDYMPIIVEYVGKQMAIQLSRPKDTANDGATTV